MSVTPNPAPIKMLPLNTVTSCCFVVVTQLFSTVYTLSDAAAGLIIYNTLYIPVSCFTWQVWFHHIRLRSIFMIIFSQRHLAAALFTGPVLRNLFVYLRICGSLSQCLSFLRWLTRRTRSTCPITASTKWHLRRASEALPSSNPNDWLSAPRSLSFSCVWRRRSFIIRLDRKANLPPTIIIPAGVRLALLLLFSFFPPSPV